MNTTSRFNLRARVLHWLSAAVILWATVSGFMILIPDFDQDTKNLIAQFNVSITTLFIPFFILRVINRVSNGIPDYKDVITRHEITLAVAMHIAIYILVAIVLVSGVLMMDKGVSVFGLIEFSNPLDNEKIIGAFKSLHEYSTRILALCVFLHIAALIRHELLGNRILRRML